jgi:hypothetical protein
MDEPLSDDELSELERLTNAVAPAPWVAFVQGPGMAGDSIVPLDGVGEFPPDMYIHRTTRSIRTLRLSSSPPRGTTCLASIALSWAAAITIP